ncbi:phage tail tip lysozyme [Methylocaldum gracile]|uniref:phage tail tip lysozyme n=1 Tax=Methylocaldum sp. 0917 TaxID=2485163 RepID=UPI00105B67CB
MNEEYVMTYLTSRGFAPHQAAGILGNLAQESGLNPRAVGDGGAAYGLAQWRGPRRAALMDFATKSNRDPNAMDTQLDFLVDELQGPEQRALNSLVSARTPQEAAIAFSRDYERPGKPNNERRVSLAQRFMNSVIPAAQADEIPPLPEGFELVTDEPTTEQPRQLQAQELPPLPEGFELVTDEPTTEPQPQEKGWLSGTLERMGTRAARLGIDLLSAVPGAENEPELQKAKSEIEQKANAAGVESMESAVPMMPRAGERPQDYAARLQTPEGREAALNVALGFNPAAPAGHANAIAAQKAAKEAERATRAGSAKSMMELSKREGVPLSYGDITQNPILRKTETALENVPFAGMTKFREGQAQAAEQSAYRLLNRFGDKIDDTGGDWGRILQSSLKGKAKFVKDAAARKYDRVAQLADPLGPVPTTRMNQTARELLGEEMLKPEAYQDAGFISLLRKYATEPGVNFSTTRAIRSDLGDLISDAYRGRNAIVGEKGAGALQRLKGALEDDMKQFATSRNPTVATAWKDADRYYRETVVPFKDGALARAAKSSTPDEIYRTFIQRGKGDRARNFYKALDQQGRDAVRYGMIKNAVDKATRENAPFSPAQFAKSLEDIQAATGVFFKGRHKQELDGLIKLMRHAERAGQYMENPPTGQRVIPFLMGGATFGGGIGHAIATSAGSFSIQKLLTTERGRNLLIRASKIKEGTAAMDNFLKRFGQGLARGTGATMNGGE